MHELLIDKYSAPLPRYTSYPTAPHFHDGVGRAISGRWLAQLAPEAPLSAPLAEPVIDEALAVAAADEDGLVRLDGDRLVVTAVGRPFVRTVAARFDSYLRQGAARYSIAV